MAEVQKPRPILSRRIYEKNNCLDVSRRNRADRSPGFAGFRRNKAGLEYRWNDAAGRPSTVGRRWGCLKPQLAGGEVVASPPELLC